MAMATQDIPAALQAYNSMISGMTPADLQNLNAMMQADYAYTGQLGFTQPLGTIPGAGTPTTEEQKITGWYIDPTTGLQTPTLAAADVYGNSNGAAGGGTNTLKAMEDLGVINGQNTVARDTLNANAGMDALKLIASERGPANAFTQQAVLHGLDSTGLSRAVGAIQGKYGLPSFSAPNASPQAAGLQSLMDQANTGGWTGAGASYANGPAATGGSASNTPSSGGSAVNPSDGGTTVFGGTHIHLGGSNAAGAPSTLDPTTAAYVNALPAPNKINATNWNNLDENTQQFLLGAYQAAGYDPKDVTSQINAGLPQFKAPSAGSIGQASATGVSA